MNLYRIVALASKKTPTGGRSYIAKCDNGKSYRLVVEALGGIRPEVGELLKVTNHDLIATQPRNQKTRKASEGR